MKTALRTVSQGVCNRILKLWYKIKIKHNNWLIQLLRSRKKPVKPASGSCRTCVPTPWQITDSQVRDSIRSPLGKIWISPLQQAKDLQKTLEQLPCPPPRSALGLVWQKCSSKNQSSPVWQRCSWWATEPQLKAALALQRKPGVTFLGWRRSTAPTRPLLIRAPVLSEADKKTTWIETKCKRNSSQELTSVDLSVF